MGAPGSGVDHPTGRRWGRAVGRDGHRRRTKGGGGVRRRWLTGAVTLALVVPSVVASGATPADAPGAAVASPGPVVAQRTGRLAAASIATAPSPMPSLAPAASGEAGPPPDGSVGEVAIAPPPARFAPDDAAPGELPAALAATPPAGAATGTGTWAVSIGIDDYPGGENDLRSAVADAREVDRAMAGYGVPPEQRLLVTDRDATAATIGLALDWLVANAGPDAEAVFFYAGHVRKLAATTEAIVGADGEVVEDVEVAERLEPLRAGAAWVAIAACYGGGFTEVVGPGRILTAAAGADDLAYENLRLGRSYLVEYMVRRAMVGGQAPESVEAAFAYAAEAIRRDHPNRVPVQDDGVAGELSFAGPAGAGAPGPAMGTDGAGAGAETPEDAPSEAPPPPSQPPPPPSQAPPEEERRDRCLGTGLRAVRCAP